MFQLDQIGENVAPSLDDRLSLRPILDKVRGRPAVPGQQSLELFALGRILDHPQISRIEDTLLDGLDLLERLLGSDNPELFRSGMDIEDKPSGLHAFAGGQSRRTVG